MTAIRAIETRYAGQVFRSRLEADYAATFDRYGIRWDYEPEGYKLSDGTWYSPDFYLPDSRAWAEVKGDHMQRLDKVEKFADELFRASGAKTWAAPNAPCVLLFTTPRRWLEGDSWNWAPVGVRGPGRLGSVVRSRCPNCSTVVIVAIGRENCPACSFDCSSDFGFWMNDAHFDFYETDFVRLPRPTGGRKRGAGPGPGGIIK